MEEDTTEGMWRRNAAAVMVDPAGRVLLCKAPGEKGFWHFPQGGANEGETMEQTVVREVREEVGIRPEAYVLEASLDGLRYRYRNGHRKLNKWIGQQQTYFLARCYQEKVRTRLARSREFVRTRWTFPRDIRLEMFTPSKRKVIETVLESFLNWSPADKDKSKTRPRKDRRKTASQKPPGRAALFSSTPIMDTDRYKVRPGTKVRLEDYDPSDRALYAGTKEESYIEFNELREEMQHLQKLLFAENNRKILVIIQAMDTGGKDGCIRHVFGWIDPQGVNVVAFKKPSDEELGHDFLWRVHKAVPGAGQITIFNRSHYEDIIAVRARNIFPEEKWRKRYQHVLDFERLLTDEGTTVVKLFLNISKAEQKARIEARLQNPEKFWKFHEDDLADRSMWDEYQKIYADVIEKTSTDYAPWYIIPANRKWYRNLIVARLFVNLMREMDIKYPKVNFDPSKIVVDD